MEICVVIQPIIHTLYLKFSLNYWTFPIIDAAVHLPLVIVVIVVVIIAMVIYTPNIQTILCLSLSSTCASIVAIGFTKQAAFCCSNCRTRSSNNFAVLESEKYK